MQARLILLAILQGVILGARAGFGCESLGGEGVLGLSCKRQREAVLKRFHFQNCRVGVFNRLEKVLKAFGVRYPV